MPITDLTGYTWVANDSPTFTNVQGNTFDIILTSDNIDFEGLHFPISPFGTGYTITYGDGKDEQLVYDTASGGWLDNAYKTITITGGTDATNSTLIQWLQDNGTLTAPSPTVNPSISIGTLSLAKAILGTTELSAIWLGNVKIYEGTPAPSGYSGNIAVYNVYGASGIHTKIKFDTPPTSEDDYDSMTREDGSILGLTSYANKTKVYVWGYISSVKINNVDTSGGGGYSIATEVLLTGNYDIYLAYSAGGSND